MTGHDRHAPAATLPDLEGPPGAVLVIADTAAVTRRAVAWATAFTALGRLHRVRLVSQGAGDIDGFVAEAIDLKATAVLAAGGQAARRAGQAVAARLGLPLAIDGPAIHGDGARAFADE